MEERPPAPLPLTDDPISTPTTMLWAARIRGLSYVQEVKIGPITAKPTGEEPKHLQVILQLGKPLKVAIRQGLCVQWLYIRTHRPSDLRNMVRRFQHGSMETQRFVPAYHRKLGKKP